MIKQAFILLILFCALQSYSQKLVCKSNGNILTSENQNLSSNQVRELLAFDQGLLDNYNTGRKKKTIGNILLVGGPVLIASDFLVQIFSPDKITLTPSGLGYNMKIENRTYPNVLTYLGVAAIIVAIPVKKGFSRRINNVISTYNNQKATGFNESNYNKLDIITNSNGIGLRLTLN